MPWSLRPVFTVIATTASWVRASHRKWIARVCPKVVAMGGSEAGDAIEIPTDEEDKPGEGEPVESTTSRVPEALPSSPSCAARESGTMITTRT